MEEQEDVLGVAEASETGPLQWHDAHEVVSGYVYSFGDHGEKEGVGDELLLDLTERGLTQVPLEVIERGIAGTMHSLVLADNMLSSFDTQTWTHSSQHAAADGDDHDLFRSCFSSLVRLDLSHNQLESLPNADTWSSLASLAYLDLGHNLLGGCRTDQSTTTNESSSSSLSLNTHSWEGICSLPALTDLRLSNNNLSSLPSAITTLSNLTNFCLSSNRLSHLPDTFASHFNHLEHLSLASNQFGTFPLMPYVMGTSPLQPSSSSPPTGSASGIYASLRTLDLTSNDIDFVPSNMRTDYPNLIITASVPDKVTDRLYIRYTVLLNQILSNTK